MRAHVLLNLLNELRKSEKNARLAEHFILLRNIFNKFNNTGAHLLESIYRVSHDNKITQKLYFGVSEG